MRLPVSLPSSYQGQHGSVAYHLTADLVRDEERILSVREEIRLTGLLDLNLEPEARTAGSSSRQKKLGCFCWRSGNISASLNTARTGYVSGEVIQFQAQVENLSSNDLDSVFLSLVQEVTFKTCGGEMREDREVARLHWREKLLARSGDDWEGDLTLPPLPPSGLAGHCSIIDLQYRLDLQVNPAGRSAPLVVSLPIILGTRPLQLFTASQSQYGDGFSLPPFPEWGGDGLKPSCLSPLPSPPPSPPPTPPPSYTDSQWAAALPLNPQRFLYQN